MKTKKHIVILVMMLMTSQCFGMASVQKWCQDYKNKKTNSVPVITNTPPVVTNTPPVVTNTTPNPDYGKYHPDGPANNYTFLWKPISDGNKKLAIVLPHTVKIPNETHLNPDTVAYVDIVLSDRATLVERQARCWSLGNGNRANYRYQKPGDQYPTNGWTKVVLKNGQLLFYHIANTSVRTEKRKPDLYD